MEFDAMLRSAFRTIGKVRFEMAKANDVEGLRELCQRLKSAEHSVCKEMPLAEIRRRRAAMLREETEQGVKMLSEAERAKVPIAPSLSILLNTRCSGGE